MNERDNIIENLTFKNICAVNGVLNSEVNKINDYTYTATRNSCALLVRPLSQKAEQQMHLQMYNRVYVGKTLIAVVFRFPKPVSSNLLKQPNYNFFNKFFRDRLDDLQKCVNNGELEIIDNLTLTHKQFMNLVYKKAVRKDKKDSDYDEIKSSRILKPFLVPQEKCKKIKQVSLNYNTVLILRNKSFNHYLKEGTEKLYTDSIIGYILEHSSLLSPDYFKYPNVSKDVEIKGKDLLKLYPHGNFKIKLPNGVKMENARKNCKRLGKNDTITFTFSDSFLNEYRDIITKSNKYKEESTSFLKIPMFFILQALDKDNLGSNGLPFLLYILALYRINQPRITHHIGNLIAELGMDTKHGYIRPIARLNKYFQYLYKVNVISEPVVYTTDDLNVRPTYNNGVLIQIKKPKLYEQAKD